MNFPKRASATAEGPTQGKTKQKRQAQKKPWKAQLLDETTGSQNMANNTIFLYNNET